MNIGIVIYGDPNQISGGYLYDRMLAQRLQASEHHVRFLSLTPGAYLSRPFSGALRSLRKQISDNGIDTIIIDELCHPSLALSVKRLRRFVPDARIVVLVHHLRRNEKVSLFTRIVSTLFERRLIADADALIVNSRSTLEEVQRICPGSAALPIIIASPSGRRFDDLLDSEFGNPDTGSGVLVAAEASDDYLPRGMKVGATDCSSGKSQTPTLKVLFVGNVIQRKGLHTLVEAISEIPAVSVTVAGSIDSAPRYVKRVLALAERYAVSDRIVLRGSVDDRRLVELYANHDVFCVPSQFEGFGIVYLEAMGFGLPAIGGSGGGAVDIINDGSNGYLVKSGDAKTLGAIFSRLVEEPERLVKMSDSARQTYTDSPTWDESMSTIEGFLQSIHR